MWKIKMSIHQVWNRKIQDRSVSIFVHSGPREIWGPIQLKQRIYFLHSTQTSYGDQPASCSTGQDMQHITVTYKAFFHSLINTTPQRIIITFRNVLLSSPIRNLNTAKGNVVKINQNALYQFSILKDCLRNSKKLEINST